MLNRTIIRRIALFPGPGSLDPGGNVLCSRPDMTRLSLIGCLALSFLTFPSGLAQQPAAVPPRVLAFFTPGGELDHFLFAQQAMRALGAGAQAGGHAFAAPRAWNGVNEATRG